MFRTRRPESAPTRDCMARAKGGDPQALGQLLSDSRPALEPAARRRLPAQLRAKAEDCDLVQATFLDAIEGFPEFRGETLEDFQAWLWELFCNNLRMFLRSFRDC